MTIEYLSRDPTDQHASRQCNDRHTNKATVILRCGRETGRETVGDEESQMVLDEMFS